mgnify:CR=1 FL=1
MHLNFKSLIAIFVFAGLCLVNSLALAADYTSNDLSGALVNSNNYNNVTIANTGSFSSNSSPYISLDGTVDGNIGITNNYFLTSSGDGNSVISLQNVGNTSSLKQINITNNGSMIYDGSTLTATPAISVRGKFDAGVGTRSFNFSLNNGDGSTISSSVDGVVVENGDNGSGATNITNSGTIRSTITDASSNAAASSAISVQGGSSSSINNTGIIENNSIGVAISTEAANSTISNSGSIKGKIRTNASSDGSLSITNSGSGTIEGNIFTGNGASLNIINNSTITGDINLGSNVNSSVMNNAGTITGNITMNNASQLFTFNGGNLNGNINGAGSILVNSDSVTNGNIGNSTSLTSLTIAQSKILDAETNYNSIRASNIILNEDSVLLIRSGALVGAVNGSSANRGTFNMLFSSDTTLSALIGQTNSIAALNLNSNLMAININSSIGASQVNIDGGGSLSLNSSAIINGDVVIGDDTSLFLQNDSSVNGSIRSLNNGNGFLEVNSNSIINRASEIGSESNRLANIVIRSNSSLTTTAALRSDGIVISSNSSITSSSEINGSISLASNSILNLQNGAVVRGQINPSGFLSSTGTINSSGSVNLFTPIGVNNSSVENINISADSQFHIANSDDSNVNLIRANNISIQGQLDLMDSTTIYGDVSMIGESSVINSNGYLQNINGNFTTDAGSKLILGIHSPTSADKLTVTGQAIISPNMKLDLSFANGGSTAVGSSYVLVEGGAGSLVSAVSDQNLLIDGVARNRINGMILRTSVSGNNLLLNVFSGFTPKPSNASVYNLISSDSSTSGGLFQLRQFIDGNASDAAKDEAIKSTMPQVDNSNNRIAFNSAQSSLDVASSRLQIFNKSASLRSPIMLASNNLRGLLNSQSATQSVWAQTFGSKISQGNTAASQGYSANLRGFAFGADKEISDNSYLGVSFSYADSVVKSRGGLKNTTINPYQLSVYHGYNFDKFFLNTLAGFVWNDYKSSRYIPVANMRAQAKYSNQTYILRSEFGLNKTLKNDFILRPSFAVTAARSSAQNYSESGAGTLNLNVRSKAASFFETRAGLVLSKKFELKNYEIFPEFSSSYGYDFAHSSQQTSANFVGQSAIFDSTANKIARGSFKVGFGTKIYKNEDLFFDINYNFEHRQNFAANSLIFKATKRF